MKKVCLLIFFVILVALAQTQFDTIWQKVQKRYEKINTIQGNFTQRICSESLGICQDFNGKFFLKRPDKLRLDVTYPDTQTIILSGKKAWFKFKGESEANEQELPAVLSPFDIFSNEIQSTVAESRIEDELLYIKLISQDTLALIPDLELWLNPKDYTIQHFSYSQGLGTESKYELSEVKYNQKISDKIFELPKPKKD
jgi:chaperone LolA